LSRMPDESEVVQMIDVRVRLVLTGLDEADLLARIEQAAGEHAPGGARPDDDVVETFVRDLGREVLRMGADACGDDAGVIGGHGVRLERQVTAAEETCGKSARVAKLSPPPAHGSSMCGADRRDPRPRWQAWLEAGSTAATDRSVILSSTVTAPPPGDRVAGQRASTRRSKPRELLRMTMLLEDTANDFDGWQSLVSDSFVPLDTEPQRRGGFTGRISARDYDSVVMSQINADPHAVLRTPGLISRTRSDEHGATANYFKVSLQLDGHGLLIQDGREMALAPGTLAIYDTSRPYTLSFDSDFSSYVMMYPQSRVNLPVAAVGQLTATPIGADHRLGAVVAQVISQAGAMLPSLNRATGVRLAGNVVDLLTTVMADELTAAGGEADERQRMWDEITDFIDAHLSDPQLSPSTIAAAHFISVRTLHQVFEGSGETVAGE